MHLRLASPGRRSSRFGALAIATGAGLLAFAAIGTTGSDTEPLPRSTVPDATEPTVLGEVIERTTSVPGADPAAAATFDLPTASSSPVTRRSGGTTTTSVLPPATLLPPVSITQDTRPYEPTTTTTVDPSTTTSDTTATTAT